MLTPIDHPLPTRPDLYRRRRFINHLLTYLLTYLQLHGKLLVQRWRGSNGSVCLSHLVMSFCTHSAHLVSENSKTLKTQCNVVSECKSGVKTLKHNIYINDTSIMR